MNYFLIFSTTVIFLTVIHAKLVEIKCPSGCKCDKYQGLKRVHCVNQNLLNLADVPNSAEILDVSYNQINVLNDHELIDMGLASLKLLNMSHNKIGHMHMYAFKNLNNIKTLDLSYNIIEYILPHWFYEIGTLKELYLNNNNLPTLTSGPLIESKSLEILDISYCGISHINEDTFSKLPNFQSLNLQGNSLIELNVKTINYLQYLQVINLNDNTWRCNRVMKELAKYLNKKGVKYQDPCRRPSAIKEEKFQRMISLDDPVDKKNAWIYDEEIKETANLTVIYNCTTNDSHELNDKLIEIIRMSPILSIVIPFTIGVVAGLIIACSIQIKPSKEKPPRPDRTKRYSVIRSRLLLNPDHLLNDQDFPLVSNCENLCESTPMPQRRFDMYSL